MGHSVACSAPRYKCRQYARQTRQRLRCRGAFAHRAIHSLDRGSIETYLVSRKAQTVHVEGRSFEFAKGEAMQVEYSYKYTDEGFAALVALGSVIYRFPRRAG